jgi:undecaprenyl-diphosphatase
LRELGWQDPPQPSAGSSLFWLSGKPQIERLSLLPQVHDGQHQALTLRYPIDETHQWVPRLWPSDWWIRHENQEVPIWIGNVSRQRLISPMGLVTVSRTERDFNQPMQFLLGQLQGREYVLLQQSRGLVEGETLVWDGRLLLLGP